MKESQTLFGIPFQLYSEQQLYHASCDFLEEPALYTVAFVAAEQCGVLAEADKQLKQSEQIIWLAGDDAVRKLFPKKERHEVEGFSICNYTMKLCEYAADMGLDICFLMEERKDVETAIDEIRKIYPYLSIHGLCLDDMMSAEMMINEINSIAPEILILGVHAGEMRRFMECDRRRTNARLCVCVGNLLIDEMSKKKKMFHTITMSRRLKKRLRKYSIKEQK